MLASHRYLAATLWLAIFVATPGDKTTMSLYDHNLVDGFSSLFPGIGSPRTDAMPNDYASNVVSMAPNTQETDIMTLRLDPKIAPVWSIVVLSRPRNGETVASPPLAVGRLYISGGGGGGIVSLAIPFDPKPAVVLTVPASTVRITIDTTVERIPGFAGVVGSGEYSAYAVPFPIGKGVGAFWTEFTDTIPGAGTGIAFSPPNVTPTFVDAICVLPAADFAMLLTPNPGPFSVIAGTIPIVVGWSFSGGPDNNVPGWIPLPSGIEGIVSVRNDTVAPARYVVIYRMRI